MKLNLLKNMNCDKCGKFMKRKHVDAGYYVSECICGRVVHWEYYILEED